MTRFGVLLAVMLIAGCRDDRPAAPTSEESAQLNEAEGMLNDLAENEEGPGDQGPHQSTTLMGTHSPGPSNSSD